MCIINKVIKHEEISMWSSGNAVSTSTNVEIIQGHLGLWCLGIIICRLITIDLQFLLFRLEKDELQKRIQYYAILLKCFDVLRH